jgi:nucleoside-diphosphate-sugar epimerase
MILVTSASGHVGTSVVHTLVKASQPVRAFVHSENQWRLIAEFGNSDTPLILRCGTRMTTPH